LDLPKEEEQVPGASNLEENAVHVQARIQPNFPGRPRREKKSRGRETRGRKQGEGNKGEGNKGKETRGRKQGEGNKGKETRGRKQREGKGNFARKLACRQGNTIVFVAR